MSFEEHLEAVRRYMTAEAKVRELELQNDQMRETLAWIKGNHANPCLGHGSLPCPICIAVDKTLTEKRKSEPRPICGAILGAHRCGLVENHECQHHSGDGVSWPD